MDLFLSLLPIIIIIPAVVMYYLLGRFLILGIRYFEMKLRK
ncbi:MAG: hypothetical protein JWN01_518 [Patescibacteria group bacterium]|nr:hypothetical protein [Patescibacteria group bacterium]